MNILEAIAAMREGYKVKQKAWNDSRYCFYNKNNNKFFLCELADDYCEEATIQDFTDLCNFYSIKKLERLEVLEYEIVE